MIGDFGEMVMDSNEGVSGDTHISEVEAIEDVDENLDEE